MKLVKQLQSHFYKTQIFKGLVDDFQKTKKVKVIPTKKVKELIKTTESQTQQIQKISAEKQALEKKIPVLVGEAVASEIQKLETLSKNEAMRFRNPQRINSYVDPDRKPLADIPFSYMRRMAQIYPIARACINYRIRQITQLKWEITTIDELENEDGFDTQIKAVSDFIKHPLGPSSKLRQFFTMMIDDVLTVDAISYEYQTTRGGDFMYLIPVDPTTIALRVTPTGGTPVAPAPAYVQIIQGKEIASFSTDEMLYDMMGNRTYSPYGMSPLESLILQCESAIRGALYNLSYFRENNIPEGFITLPEDSAMTKAQIEEWQMWFDAILAGDNRTIHRLKFLPGGAEYTAAKKPEDMAFERFELWLLQQTCAMFEVQPSEIGITLHVNKATSQQQNQTGQSRGLIPLSNWVKEILDDLIQNPEKLNCPELQFIWGNLDPVDEAQEVEIETKEINSAIQSVDEVRIKRGLEPIGVDHYIMTTSGPLFVKDLIAGKVGPLATQQAFNDQKDQNDQNGSGGGFNDKNSKDKNKNEDDAAQKAAQLELQDIRRWKKCIYRDFDGKRKLRIDFASDYIRPEIREKIAKSLKDAGSKFQAKIIFDQYIDPELKASMTLLEYAEDLRKIEHDTASS